MNYIIIEYYVPQILATSIGHIIIIKKWFLEKKTIQVNKTMNNNKLLLYNYYYYY